MSTALDVRRVYWQRLADAAAVVGGSPPDPELYLRRSPTLSQRALTVGVGTAMFYQREALAAALGVALLGGLEREIFRK